MKKGKDWLAFVSCALLLGVLAFPCASIAGEPAWWTQQKRKCGLSSSLAYNTWVSQGSSCNSGGGSSGGSTPAAELGKALGQIIGQKIGEAIRGNPQEDDRRQAEHLNELMAEQEAERRRAAEQARVRSEEQKNRLLGSMLDVSESSQLGLIGLDSVPGGLGLIMDDPPVSASISQEKGDPVVKAAVTNPPSAGFTKGFEDASQCYSQNSSSRCAGVAAEQQQACLQDYQAGYQVGDKQRVRLMQEAGQAGRLAGGRGELANAASNPLAEGPCRVEWIESYNQGYFQGKHDKMK